MRCLHATHEVHLRRCSLLVFWFSNTSLLIFDAHMFHRRLAQRAQAPGVCKLVWGGLQGQNFQSNQIDPVSFQKMSLWTRRLRAVQLHFCEVSTCWWAQGYPFLRTGQKPSASNCFLGTRPKYPRREVGVCEITNPPPAQNECRG